MVKNILRFSWGAKQDLTLCKACAIARYCGIRLVTNKLLFCTSLSPTKRVEIGKGWFQFRHVPHRRELCAQPSEQTYN